MRCSDPGVAADPVPRRPRRPRRHGLVRRRPRRPGRRRPLRDGRRPDRARRADVAGAPLYLADEHPELGLTGPDDGRVSVSLHLTVPDVDARGRPGRGRVGATVERPPADAPYGRTGVIVDPYGHRWMLQTPFAARAPGPRPGDVVVPDAAGARRRPRPRLLRGGPRLVDRARARARRLAGRGHHPDDRHRRRRGRSRAVVPMYAVDDIEVAVAAVRTAGGEAGRDRAAAVRAHRAVPRRPGPALLPAASSVT